MLTKIEELALRNQVEVLRGLVKAPGDETHFCPAPLPRNTSSGGSLYRTRRNGRSPSLAALSPADIAQPIRVVLRHQQNATVLPASNGHIARSIPITLAGDHPRKEHRPRSPNPANSRPPRQQHCFRPKHPYMRAILSRLSAAVGIAGDASSRTRRI
jgi:hypothetical protein